MSERVTFHDFHPGNSSLRDAVIEGLSRDPKAIAPKFFYDEHGSYLFDVICEQPEYYLPAAERTILSARAAEIAEHVGPDSVVVEPGAGSGEKLRLFIDALRPRAYVPIDISGDYLQNMARDVSEAYSWLQVHATCADFSQKLALPSVVPEGRRLAFFPGSSLGNFEPQDARRFLQSLRQMVARDGMLLIGVDTKKEERVLNAAYNDARGVTAAFNRNLLERINRELGGDFDPLAFSHEAFYDAKQGRVEMHLVSRSDQQVSVQGQRIYFHRGERLHTERSYKYAPSEFLDIAEAAGFDCVDHWTDDDELFRVYLLSS
jgi:dimethylhistidine N-methyltransferase